MSLFSRFRKTGARPPRDETEDILGRHLTHDFKVFPMAQPRTSVASVRALGKRLGFELPPELLAHLSGPFPGVYVEAKAEVWPRPEYSGFFQLLELEVCELRERTEKKKRGGG